MAITYFGSIGVPSDPGTSATSPVSFANPPIASMQAGDLVVIFAYCRNASATIAIGNAGGQSWTSETTHQSSTSTLTARVFWCRFNGTWNAAPTVTFSSTTNTSATMHVFRPTTSTNSWGLSGATTTAQENTLRSFSAAASVGIPQDAGSYTPDQNENVTVALVATQDDNTWNAAGGTSFTKMSAPSGQFRNTSGSDTSSCCAWLIQTTASSVSAQNVFTQATLGNDPGIIGFYIFYEFTPPTDVPPLGHFFGPVISVAGLIAKTFSHFLNITKMKRSIQILLMAVITLSLMTVGCSKRKALPKIETVAIEATKAPIIRNLTLAESQAISKVNFGLNFSSDASSVFADAKGRKHMKISQAIAQSTLATWTQLGSINATYVATPTAHIDVNWSYDTTQFTPLVSPPAKCIVWTMVQKMYSSDGVNIDVLPSDDPQNIQLIASPATQWTQSWVTSWNGIEVLVNHLNAPKSLTLTDNWPFGGLGGMPPGSKIFIRVAGSYGTPIDLSSATDTNIWHSDWFVIQF